MTTVARTTATLRRLAGAPHSVRGQVILGRERYILLGGLAGMVICAWLYLFHLAQSMGDMPMQAGAAMATVYYEPWSAVEFFAMSFMWAIMMVGMMLPSAAPAILMFANISRKHRAEGRRFPSTVIFVSGYVMAWAAFSVAATALQWGLHSLLLLSPMMRTSSPVLGAALFVVAGAYQFTPLKRACLKHCRSPLAFMLTRWRDGNRGALIMGLDHGVFCLGCCWVLMTLLFVGGVMNLVWVGVITVFVLIEKLAPRGEYWARVAGAILMTTGAVLAYSA